MRICVLVILFCCFYSKSNAQKSFTPDTLLAGQRALGNTDSLLQFMDGFAAPFFIGPQQVQPDTWALFKPGIAPLSSVSYATKKLLFSALPHLGFAFGFGAQGAQRLRLDYEQQFAKRTLLNVRYDRYQRTGFIRSDGLRYSSLDIKVMQRSNRLTMMAVFSNFSNDRQWSNGVADWSAIFPGNTNLVPARKNEAFSFENAYELRLENSYMLSSDSTSGFRILSKHSYENKLRRYEETDSLELFYTQLYLNSDSCRDRFSTQVWNNAAGIGFVGLHLDWQSTLQLKQMRWQDTQFAYDTTEINIVNELIFKSAHFWIEHQSTFNIIGAGGGQVAQSRLVYKLPFSKVDFYHDYRNAWPVLMQRTYISNITQYQQLLPEREQVNLFKLAYHFEKKNINSNLKVAYMHARQIYRFSTSTMSWVLEGPQHAFEAEVKAAYKLGAWRIGGAQKYTFWQRSEANVLLPFRSQVRLEWAGGVFKNKQLHLHAGIGMEALYGAQTTRISYISFMETIDWQVYEAPAINPVSQLYNAQLDIALEVKTFRFFVQATNLLTAIDYTASQYNGLPYPTFQLRLGLTWDFWN
ncbi:MAG: hypothetical protein ACKO5N_00610 [Sphingomonadales bacterium]